MGKKKGLSKKEMILLEYDFLNQAEHLNNYNLIEIEPSDMSTLLGKLEVLRVIMCNLYIRAIKEKEKLYGQEKRVIQKRKSIA